MEFQIGDKVYKHSGSYRAYGYIRAVFTTRAGLQRVVFEFEGFPGMLHIFTPEQLEIV